MEEGTGPIYAQNSLKAHHNRHIPTAGELRFCLKGLLPQLDGFRFNSRSSAQSKEQQQEHPFKVTLQLIYHKYPCCEP